MHPYQKAKKVADRVMELLWPHVSIARIAGSISRQCTTVKDIEIVCLPKPVLIETDLFGNGKLKRDPGFAAVLKNITHQIVKGTPDGRYMQVVLRGGIVLDLFMPEAYDYYRILTMRTGPADYSNYVIATGWVTKGWCGTDNGLRRIVQCTQSPSGWKCWHPRPELPPVWKSEREFFAWLDLPYLEPRYREVPQKQTYSR